MLTFSTTNNDYGNPKKNIQTEFKSIIDNIRQAQGSISQQITIIYIKCTYR